jgi:hypothetical protein
VENPDKRPAHKSEHGRFQINSGRYVHNSAEYLQSGCTTILNERDLVRVL